MFYCALTRCFLHQLDSAVIWSLPVQQLFSFSKRCASYHEKEKNKEASKTSFASIAHLYSFVHHRQSHLYTGTYKILQYCYIERWNDISLIPNWHIRQRLQIKVINLSSSVIC